MPFELVSFRSNNANADFSFASRQSKKRWSLRSAIAFNSGSVRRPIAVRKSRGPRVSAFKVLRVNHFFSSSLSRTFEMAPRAFLSHQSARSA